MRFYVIPLRYVFKLIGFSPKGRPKMRQFFGFLLTLNKKNFIFLPVFIPIIIISELTINIRSIVLKNGVFRSS